VLSNQQNSYLIKRVVSPKNVSATEDLALELDLLLGSSHPEHSGGCAISALFSEQLNMINQRQLFCVGIFSICHFAFPHFFKSLTSAISFPML